MTRHDGLRYIVPFPGRHLMTVDGTEVTGCRGAAWSGTGDTDGAPFFGGSPRFLVVDSVDHVMRWEDAMVDYGKRPPGAGARERASGE